MSTNENQLPTSSDRPTGSNTGPIATRSGFTADTVQACLDIVDERRRGIISSSQATLRLVRLLPEPSSIHALKRYTEKIDEIDRLHMQALQRGNNHLSTEPNPITGKTGEIYGEQGIRSSTRETDNEEFEPSINEEPLDKPIVSESTIPRKRHPDESLFAWNHPSNICLPIDPKLELTLKLKNNYVLDLKLSKISVLGIPRCPIFPDSQWNDVLLDRYVDFDKILTSYYALESEHRDTQTIGNLDISLNTGGSSKPSKEIRIYGEWTIAYARYTRAVLFVYPHRMRELEDYQEYMAGQFSAYPDTADQYKVINFDKAIQIRVGQANDLLLMDFS